MQLNNDRGLAQLTLVHESTSGYKQSSETFSFNDLKLTKMTLDQHHDTISGHKQYLCAIRTINVSP